MVAMRSKVGLVVACGGPLFFVMDTGASVLLID